MSAHASTSFDVTPSASALKRTRRVAYAVLLAALAAAVVFEVSKHGHWGAALAGTLAPDLALLLGAGPGLARGQLHPRAVGSYNAVHRFFGPAALIGAASLGLLGAGWLIGGLAWSLHIALDRVAGYGLRTKDGFQRGA
jgi:hypothetical protein